MNESTATVEARKFIAWVISYYPEIFDEYDWEGEE